MWATQIGIFVCSGLAAFLLRFDLSIPAGHLHHLAFALAIWIAVKSLVFRLGSLDRGWWRYVSVADVARIGLVNLSASALSAVLILMIGPPGFPRSIYLLDLILCVLASAGVRVMVRVIAEAAAQNRHDRGAKRTLIYGAGEAGITLLREIRSNPRLPYRVCGFVDDHPEKAGVRIQGRPVLGSGADLASLARVHNVEEVLIAVPSATGEQMIRILEQCRAANVRCRTVPGLGEVVEGKGLAGQIRDVAMEDLLGRGPVRLEEKQIRGKLEGKVVIVTGAAGSIGSELCRQIARFRPAAIVGFDAGETPLFHLELEMRQLFPNVTFHAEIGSVQNTRRLEEVLRLHEPTILYHAAAYKHVPMMEAHMFEAVENNVFGTYNAARLAAECGLTDFVMISTDKAVRPTSVMGATKRVAELVVNSLQNGGTKFASVRFGNVLGSNGSVIPLFKKQIADGGPVTVTHPDMQRYFMTIPEAAQLVLQASTMGRGGEIFVLNMGKPVRIVDLARNLILLSGLRPNEDVKIEFTGVRPGEKLFEELHTCDESTAPTRHEKISIYSGACVSIEDMYPRLGLLKQICAEREVDSLLLWLKDLIPEYNPSGHVLRRALSGSVRTRQEVGVRSDMALHTVAGLLHPGGNGSGKLGAATGVHLLAVPPCPI